MAIIFDDISVGMDFDKSKAPGHQAEHPYAVTPLAHSERAAGASFFPTETGRPIDGTSGFA
ncbi:hypothetical protein [Rhizobium chutanense]|uniref:hypothetical protein n=1 Tax=Rhizobium chutanense TaxID=2035448 RepID=UPI0013DF4A90|nr:hypothetical protein [Rhizobium chutanense]